MSSAGAVGMVLGDAVWLTIGGLTLAWLAVTVAAGPRRLPGVVDVVRWFLQSWPGRLAALTGWAVAGWHLFLQRP
jgi:hypothetical protein